MRAVAPTPSRRKAIARAARVPVLLDEPVAGRVATPASSAEVVGPRVVGTVVGTMVAVVVVVVGAGGPPGRARA